MSTHGFEMCQLYLEGVSALAKNDLHLHLEPQGFISSYRTLQIAVRHCDPADKSADLSSKSTAEQIRGIVKYCVPNIEDERLTRIVAIGAAMDGHTAVSHAITVEDVTVLKFACDVFLHRTFHRRETDESRNHRRLPGAIRPQPLRISRCNLSRIPPGAIPRFRFRILPGTLNAIPPAHRQGRTSSSR